MAPGGLEKWWKDTGLANRGRKFDKKETTKAYNEFQLLFYRLVCLSSVRLVPDPFHTWAQIQGNNPRHMAAGHATADPAVRAPCSLANVDIKDILNRSHDAYKVLFFNKEQMSYNTEISSRR